MVFYRFNKYIFYCKQAISTNIYTFISDLYLSALGKVIKFSCKVSTASNNIQHWKLDKNGGCWISICLQERSYEPAKPRMCNPQELQTINNTREGGTLVARAKPTPAAYERSISQEKASCQTRSTTLRIQPPTRRRASADLTSNENVSPKRGNVVH